MSPILYFWRLLFVSRREPLLICDYFTIFGIFSHPATCPVLSRSGLRSALRIRRRCRRAQHRCHLRGPSTRPLLLPHPLMRPPLHLHTRPPQHQRTRPRPLPRTHPLPLTLQHQCLQRLLLRVSESLLLSNYFRLEKFKIVSSLRTNKVVFSYYLTNN